MTSEPYFVTKIEVRCYKIQDINLDIEVNPLVFPPPKNNPISSEYLVINKNESVIDIGTGSGILAILAAKLGGIVCATDIDKNAIKLAEDNSKRNNVRINFSVGKYFASFTDKFDVIVANLSQTIIPPNAKNKLGPVSRSVAGGPNGNKQPLKLLRKAKKHMHNKSRLYLNIFTISDYKDTIKEMAKEYNAKLIARQTESIKEFIEENIEWYKLLNNKGKIKLIFDPNKKSWFAEQYFYELKLK